MTSANLFAPPGENRLLNLLPPAEREQVLARVQPRQLELREVIVRPNRPIEHVYFPTGAIASVLTVMQSGEAVETGTIGNEGFVGIPVLLGVNRYANEVICQSPGDALVLRSDDLRVALERSTRLRDILLRYTQTFLVQSSQSTACNRLHDVNQRCARWILMTHDRLGRDTMQLTQEFLAMMLGVRRASVSVAAALLQEAGYIRYRRGGVTILDRAGLESAACECYAVTRAEYDRLFGSDGAAALR